MGKRKDKPWDILSVAMAQDKSTLVCQRSTDATLLNAERDRTPSPYSVSSRFRRCWCATHSKTAAIGLCCCSPCALGSANGFLQGAWPFGLVEAVWSIVALRRWLIRV